MPEDKIITLKESEVEVIDVNEAEIVDIELEEVFGTVDEANNALNHALLHNRDIQDQHPITAITGLRAELDEIESLKTVYSDEKQQADYYLWHDENPLFENRDGFFVSMHKDVEHNIFHSALCCIEICDGSQDVFGVTVAEAGFVGGQEYVQADGGAKIGRDRKYGLVVHSGLVGVRRETNVAIGDYVVPNIHGVAEKSDGDYGYLVTALSEVNGVQYAIISLVAPSTLAEKISDNVQDLNERMATAESNITSVTNVANSAYVMALDAKENAEVSSEYIKEKVEEVLGRMDTVDGVIGNLSESVNGASTDAAAARAIANSAVSSANAMKDEAVGKANEALEEMSKTKTELEGEIEEIKADLDNIDIEELQEIKESIESTLDQLQSDLNSVTSELENTKTNLNNTRDELSANIDKVSTDLNNELNETKSNFEALEDDLEPLVMWPEDTEASDATGIAGFIARANKDSTTLGELVKWKGETNTAIAGVTQTANDNKASIDTITLWKGETDESLATVSQKADNNSTSIQSLTSWQNNASESITKVEQKANANESSIQSLTEWKDGATQSIANIEEKSNANESSILLLTTWKSDVEDDVESIAAIKTQSNANKSAIESLTSWKEGANASLTSIKQQSDANKASIDEITLWQGTTNESIAQIKQQADDNSASLESLASWKDIDVDSIAAITQRVDDAESEIETLTLWKNDATTAIANVEQKANANETKINSLTSWQGTTNTAIANVEQKATANESAINSLTSWKDETSESITAIKQTADKNSAEISTIASWKSDVEEDVSSIASIESIADANKASIEELVKKDTELSTTIAGVKTTADANKAEIEEITSWKSKVDPTINSVASIKQTADGNAAKIEGLTAWQGTTNTSMAQLQQKADANGAQIEALVSDIDKYAVGEYSQAYGLTLEQAKSILSKDLTVYVPTIKHSETYTATTPYTREFIPGYYYTWNGSSWTAYSSTAVKFSSAYVQGTTTSPYWVVTIADVVDANGTTYDLGGLYKWEQVDGNWIWVKVASIADNTLSRAVSAIKQTADSVSIEVTNVKDDMAGLTTRVGNTETSLQTVTTWKSTVEEDVSKIATIEQKTNDNTSSIALVVSEKDGEEVINAASIVTAINDGESSVNIDADHIDFTAGDFTIDADHIQFTGQKLNIKVDSTNIDGTLTIGQLPDTVAETDDIPTKTSDLTNDSGFQNATGVVTIAKGAITADYIKSLNLEVGNQIQMGKNATISWGSVTETDNIASKSDVSTAKEEAITTASNDATSKANDAKSSAVSEIEQKGYQTQSQVTKITNDTISTTNVVAQNLQVKAANIEGALTATQIDVDNLSAISANMGTVTAGEIRSNNYSKRDICTVNTDGSLTSTDAAYDVGLPAGLYDDDYNMVASWSELTEKGLKCKDNYTSATSQSDGSPSLVLNKFSNGTRLIISNQITYIGTYAFYKNSTLKSVTIPDSVTSIGGYAFKECSKLTSITLPCSCDITNAAWTISTQAFAACDKLTNIIIHNRNEQKRINIGNNVFKDSNNIVNKYFTGVNLNNVFHPGSGINYWEGSDSNTDIKPKTEYFYIPNVNETRSADKNYWTIIGPTFSGFKLSCNDENMIDSRYFKVTQDGRITATDVDLSGKITATSGEIAGLEITEQTIQTEGYGNLGIALNNGSEGLSYTDYSSYYTVNALSSSLNVAELIIPGIYNNKPVTVISRKAFSASEDDLEFSTLLPNVKKIIIPSTVTTINFSAFRKAPMTDLIINASLSGSLPNFIFAECSNLINVTFSNSVTQVGSLMFDKCTALKYIIIPNSVTKIGAGAFRNCSSLEDVALSDSITQIPSTCFSNCLKLTNIIIPSSITSIAADAFSDPGEGKFFNVYYKGTPEQWNALTENIEVLQNRVKVYYYNDNYDSISNSTISNYWTNATGFKISGAGGNMIDSKYFKVTQDGRITATNGEIGSLTLQDGNLVSDNFRLETALDQNGKQKTQFILNAIDTQTIISDSSVETTVLKATNLDVANEISLSGYTTLIKNSIKSGDTSLTLNSGSTTKTYYAKLFRGPSKGSVRYFTIKVYSDGTCQTEAILPNTTTFNIKCYFNDTGANNPYNVGTVTVLGGKSEGTSNAFNSVLGYSNNDESAFIYTVDETGTESQYHMDDTYSFTVKNNLNIQCTGNFIPDRSSNVANKQYKLGLDGTRWSYIYGIYCDVNSCTCQSDQKFKDKITDIDINFSKQLINGLYPKSYIFKTATTPRTHYGFIAQDVEDLLVSLGTSADEVGLVVKSKPGEPDSEDNHYSLNYIDLMAHMVNVIQQLNKRVDALESQQND